ncbi:hypothetical protein N3Z17_01800 [Candidatus Bandiella numerosa]|uniref:hypothetical protein n=1 Tax=Candidatus Bandiella numerosa TaxID=2570586 RepID=UPI00249E1736|nr:hypothetical protein [Candidatus Bandiella numerosa]WHA05267.1 hypothetical protein N3Z17_01800 [Candidatus Bandiella numerosa]
MNAQVDAVNLRIVDFNESLVEKLASKQTNLLDAFKELQGLESEKWWAEQWEKLENAKNATIDAFNRAGTSTKEHAQAAKEAISKWFGEMGEKMSAAWASFKETVGQKWENFKGDISEFGDKIAEMWGKAMDSLGKLWDDLKIGAHDKYVDLKTGVLNLCTDMQCSVANLGIGMQKAGLAMDDAYQQVKGSISGAIGAKFSDMAGQLLVESKEVTNQVIAKSKEFTLMDLEGYDPKTIASAQKHQASVLADLQEQQKGLEDKAKSRESVSNYMDGVKDKADFKKDVFNVNSRSSLDTESHLNSRKGNALKSERNEGATQEKQSYADKVREARATSKGTGIGGK